MEQISEATLAGGKTALISIKHQSPENDTGTTNLGIEFTVLKFLRICCLIILMNTWRVSALSIDADNLFGAQIDIRRQDCCQSSLFLSRTNTSLHINPMEGLTLLLAKIFARRQRFSVDDRSPSDPNNGLGGGNKTNLNISTS